MHPYGRHAESKAGNKRAKAILKASGGSCGSDLAPMSSAGVKGRKKGTSAMMPDKGEMPRGRRQGAKAIREGRQG